MATGTAPHSGQRPGVARRSYPHAVHNPRACRRRRPRRFNHITAVIIGNTSVTPVTIQYGINKFHNVLAPGLDAANSSPATSNRRLGESQSPPTCRQSVSRPGLDTSQYNGACVVKLSESTSSTVGDGR